MRAPPLNGILAVYKPPSITSAKCLELVKANLSKALGVDRKKLKLGHGGTLDPMAEGVLVVGIGEGCKRLSSYLAGNKEYRFELALGTHYDTFDVTGKVLETASYEHVTEEAVRNLLPTFTGDIMQRPPIFSALRIDGRRAYDIARKGGDDMPEMQPRPIRIDSLVLDSFSPQLLTFTAQVGGGCYIRSLCVDMAQALESKGAMSKLVRTRQGQFGLDQCLWFEDWGNLDKIKFLLK